VTTPGASASDSGSTITMTSRPRRRRRDPGTGRRPTIAVAKIDGKQLVVIR
jgi:hypothetical protein